MSGSSHRRIKQRPLLDKTTIAAAMRHAFVMLRPDIQWKNPVMFVVEIGACVTFLYILHMIWYQPATGIPLTYFISLEIWFLLTVLFANFATSLAEARGKAQTDSLRKTRCQTLAYRLNTQGEKEEISSLDLQPGDKVIVITGQIIPGDGEIIDGMAYVNESAITGESAPVLREAGGDRSGVIGGTLVISDKITVQITAKRGCSFLDRMIAMVEGSVRQKTPNEISLGIILSAFTLIFLLVVVPLFPMAYHAEHYMTQYLGLKHHLKSLGTDAPTLIALLVCLAPTTIGALLAAIGIAGMDRAMQANIIAKSGLAVELAGDIDVVLLDKTGTITVGSRKATQFMALQHATEEEVARWAAISSVSDQTSEGKSILELYEKQFQIKVHAETEQKFIPFSAHTRMSGVDLCDGKKIRKGAPSSILTWVTQQGGTLPQGLDSLIERVARQGATPLAIAVDHAILGLVILEDVLKPKIHEKIQHLRDMGLKTVMITGDNPLTAEAIAHLAGVDTYIAEVTPEKKQAYIESEQQEGRLVAMIGDGTNDAPALAQADVAVAMNAGTDAAKEAANMVDLDNDPTKLIKVIEIGKQLLITRGSLTTFSIANDVAKYFAIIPALFAGTLPWLQHIDIMHLHSPTSAILSTVIFNALIIPFLIPIAFKGVRYRRLGADALLRRNLMIWGLGGLVTPFVGIKCIDFVMTYGHVIT